MLLRRRPEKGLLGGMMEVPSTPWTEAKPRKPERHAPLTANWTKLQGKIEHTFTHFHLILTVQTATLPTGTNPLRGEWHPKTTFRPADLPTLMRKAYEDRKSVV